MSKIEPIMRNIISPTLVKFVILFGIIVGLTGVTIAIYGCLKKKLTLKHMMVYLGCTFGIGLLISMFGLLVNYVLNFNINFSDYKLSIPCAYIVSLITFSFLVKIVNKKNKE